MDVVGARRLLDLPVGFTRDDVVRAFRARIAVAHPDRGGDAEEAARLSAARDALLDRLSGTPVRGTVVVVDDRPLVQKALRRWRRRSGRVTGKVASRVV